MLVVRYFAIDMILPIDSNAAYLVLSNAKSRLARCYYLSSDPIYIAPPINASFLISYEILKHIISSAAKAETARVFMNV